MNEIRPLLVGVVLALIASPVWSRDREAQFLLRNQAAAIDGETVSSRTTALGGTYAARAGGVAGLYENPASLGVLAAHELRQEYGWRQRKGPAITGHQTHYQVGAAINLNRVVDNLPRQRYGNQTAALGYRRSYFTYNDRSLENSINGFTFGWGRSLAHGQLHVGASTGPMWGRTKNQDAWIPQQAWFRWESKVGMIYQASDNLSFGAVGRLGLGTFEGRGSNLMGRGRSTSFEMRPGMAYRIGDALTLSSDLSLKYLGLSDTGRNAYSEHFIWRWQNGMEYEVVPGVVRLQSGWYLDYNKGNSVNTSLRGTSATVGGFTGGASLVYKQFEGGYAADINTYGEWRHMLTLRFNW